MRKRLGTKAEIIVEIRETAREMIKNERTDIALDMITDVMLASVKASALKEWMMFVFPEFNAEEEE